MDVAKILLWAIAIVLVVIIFFSLTGIDPRHPMPGVYRILGQVGNLGRSINAMFRGFADSFMNNLPSFPGR